MYTLYYMPGSCSMAVHVALNELGESVTLENVSDPSGKGQRSPEFLALNPRGNVPTLVEDGHVIREGGAILVYLLDKHHSPLLPRSGKERATALEWLMFCNASLHPAYGRVFGAMKLFSGDAQKQAISAGLEQINRLWKDVEQRLEKSPYLAGDDVTIADILLTVIANWMQTAENKPVIGVKTKALLQKIIARPSYQKAIAAEKVDYKAAA